MTLGNKSNLFFNSVKEVNTRMNTIIIYTSMTGTTELMAKMIARELSKLGDLVVIKDAMEAYVEDLKSNERILVGSYTWGDGVLPDEILDFYEDLQGIDLTGKRAAVFGSGDSSYDHFARAVDIFEEILRSRGCEILTEGLKVECPSEKEIEERCRTFSENLHMTPCNLNK